MLRAQWEEIRSTSYKKLRGTDKWRLKMRDKHVHPITTKMCINDDKHIYIYKIDVCLLSSTKSFEEFSNKSGQGALLMGWVLGVFLGGRSVGSGNWTAEAIFNEWQTASRFTTTKKPPHLPKMSCSLMWPLVLISLISKGESGCCRKFQ